MARKRVEQAERDRIEARDRLMRGDPAGSGRGGYSPLAGSGGGGGWKSSRNNRPRGGGG